MSDVSDPAIKEAYDEVRNDASDINWLLITYEEGSNNKKWILFGKGSGGLEELRGKITDTFLGFGYLRVTSGDEMSKRAKFVFIKYLSKGLKMNLKALINVHRGDVEKVLNQISIAVEAEGLDELSDAEIDARIQKASGAHYGTSGNI
jgi:hypothetical protein